MRRYVLKRLLYGFVSLIGVSIIIFILSRSSGDVALAMAPTGASEELLQEIRTRFGLDKPIHVQYYYFVKNALKGDFGESIAFREPVMKVIAGRLPVTLKLGLISYIISNILGILLGVFLARRPSKWLEQSSKIFALLGQAMPQFWLALMLMLVFAVKLHWLPTSGIGGIKYMILPLVTLCLFGVSFTMRQARSSLLDVMDMEYIKMARIKGNPERVVIWKHAFRNAMIPVVTMLSIQLSMILQGSVFVETIFRWEGVGYLMVYAINSGDYPLTQAIVMIIAVCIIIMMLIKDLLYVIIDPRIKYD